MNAALTGRRGGANAPLLVLLVVCACGAALLAAPSATAPEFSDDLVVRKLAPGVWLFVTFEPGEKEQRISANGLLVTTGEISYLIDTGWSANQTRQLLDWADETLGQPVEHVIVTHYHPDRTGGLDAVYERPVVVHGHAGTSESLHAAGRPPLHWTFEFEERLELGGEKIHLFYPGPGHTRDNVVVWLPRRQILFVGCLVKSAAARDLGNVDEADMKNWPVAVRRIIERYRDAEILVPGHGKPGGVELLSHTMELLEQAE